MGAVFRNDSFRIPVIPSATLACGTVVYVNGLVGVATRPIEKDTYGEIQLVGEYDVDVSGVTASQGEIVTVAAKTLGGEDTTCKFGPAVAAVTSSDTVARLRLDCMANYGGDGSSSSSSESSSSSSSEGQGGGG